MSRMERFSIARELIALRHENEQLRQVIQDVIARGNAQQKQIKLPDSAARTRDVMPPWERAGTTKQQWLRQEKLEQQIRPPK